VGFGFPGLANTNNRAIQEATIGFTQTLWGSPEHGKLQFITQSSYVVRSPWSVAIGSPKNAHAFLEYVDQKSGCSPMNSMFGARRSRVILPSLTGWKLPWRRMRHSVRREQFKL